MFAKNQKYTQFIVHNKSSVHSVWKIDEKVRSCSIKRGQCACQVETRATKHMTNVNMSKFLSEIKEKRERALAKKTAKLILYRVLLTSK